MKIINTLSSWLLVLLASSQLYAQTGSCIIRSGDGAPIYIALDNKFQHTTASPVVKITNIPEGDYWVTVLFKNPENQSFKSNIRVIEGQTGIHLVFDNQGQMKLQEQRSVVQGKESIEGAYEESKYQKSSLAVMGFADATKVPKERFQTKTEINRVRGVIDEQDPESKRMGKFKGSTPPVASTAPEVKKEAPEPGTTIISKYVEVENADGTTSIIEEKNIIVKKIVERNGQKQMRTRKSTQQIPTDFSCLPMQKESFLSLKNDLNSAEAKDRLSMATEAIEGQCLTPGQIKVLGALMTDEENLNSFAIAAKPTCADAAKFPLNIKEPTVAINEAGYPEKDPDPDPMPVEEVKPPAPPKPKTKAELKAEMKALKIKQRKEKKAARAKAKAEKAAAKAKAKAEKAAAKAAKAKK